MPCELRPDIPEAAQRIILQALSFDPKDRPQNIRIFGRNLADALRHVGDTKLKYNHISQPIETRPTSNQYKAESRLTNRDPQIESEAKDSLLNQSIITEVRQPAKTSEKDPAEPNTARLSAENENPPKPSRNWLWFGLGFSGLLILLTAVSLIAGFGLLNYYGTSTDKSAVNANASPNTQVPPAVMLNQISYYLNVQKMRFGKPYEEPFRATGREIFESGYKFKMVFNSNEDGYLYLFNEGKNKNGETAFYILYPTSEQADSEKITANSDVETGYQIFGGGKGTEIIWLIWTKELNTDLQEVKQAALNGTGGSLQEANESELLSAFLRQYDERQIEIIKDTDNQMTTIGSSKDTLIHRLTLEHK